MAFEEADPDYDWKSFDLEKDRGCVKFGSLPIPRSAIERAVSRLFDSPENREQFRVPPNIRDIRVENGTLVVSY